MIYLDHAAMTPPIPAALEAYHAAPFGNPSSEHALGQQARDALEQAREKIAALMDCEPEEVYFTSTATEAAATASRSIFNANCAEKECDHKWYVMECSPYEHHAITGNAFTRKKIKEVLNVGAQIMIRGRSVEPKLLPSMTAISQMLANNETGELFRFPAGTDTTGAPNIHLWLCDATAAVGHIPVSFKNLGCDYLLADGIKFGSVPGAAFLIAKKGVPLSPLIRGGGQERGMRSGTENLPAICAMAAALEWQTEHMEENTQHVSALRQMLFQILSRIPDHKWNTPFEKPCVPHILNISFDGVDAHALAMLLSRDGVMVSPGAACSNGLNEPSHVIMAMFHDEARARSAVRISLSHQNTADEIAEAGQKITEAVSYLRSLS